MAFPRLSSGTETAMPFPYCLALSAATEAPVAGKIASLGQIGTIANIQFAPVVGASLAVPSV